MLKNMFHVWKINILKVYTYLSCTVRKNSSSSRAVYLPTLCKHKQKGDLSFSSCKGAHLKMEKIFYSLFIDPF